MEYAKFELKGFDGQLYVYDDKIVIERKGVLSFVRHEFAGSRTIPISAIRSVQLQKAPAPTLSGFIRFGVLDGAGDMYGLKQNTVLILTKNNDIAEQIKNYIENRISQKTETTTSNSISPIDEIKQLKELLDSGILTEEEFQAKKKQLLGI